MESTLLPVSSIHYEKNYFSALFGVLILWNIFLDTLSKVSKRLQNVRENPDSDDVLKNTLDNEVLFEFIAEYEKNNASGLKTIANTATCRKQISKVLETLHINFLDQFIIFSKSEQAILHKITRKLK